MINSTIQSTIGFSPAEVVYGKKIYREWPPTGNTGLPTKEYVRLQSKNRRIMQDEIQLNERKVKYDNSHRTHRQFNIGDLVLIKKDDRYDGPGEVIGKKHDRSYTIKMGNEKIMTRNIEWLKLFFYIIILYYKIYNKLFMLRRFFEF